MKPESDMFPETLLVVKPTKTERENDRLRKSNAALIAAHASGKNSREIAEAIGKSSRAVRSNIACLKRRGIL